MNKQIKQRLIGAVVLVSLAVIFIPMLLDGGTNSTMPRFGSNIPAQPEFDFEPLEIPLQAITPIPTDRPRVIEQEAALAPTVGQPLQEQPTQEKPAQEKPATSPLPATAPTAAPIRWVVQVGSFSQSANAMALRDRLRKGGFSAFVEKFQDRGKSSYRVRVGPELKRENAEKQRERLDKHFRLKGIIMGHS